MKDLFFESLVGNTTKQVQLIEFLTQFTSDSRKAKFEEVLNNRTRHMTIVLEDIFQPQNASAVLRSCDCFGVQDVHIIENENEYSINPDVALGSPKWLTLKKYNKEAHNTKVCLDSLKSKGYQIVATTPHERDCNLQDLNIDKPFALVFGTEQDGISDIVRQEADAFVKIPMFGFTESLNISVCAALCMHTLVNRIHQSDLDWKLQPEERNDIMLRWLCKSINKSDMLVEEFERRYATLI